MDLIYANESRIDLGVIQNYSLDLAFGSDENNFVCTLDLAEPQCKENYILYIDHTEYGGIIDAIGANTADNTMTYSGRTWHGILASKVIEPDNGEDYYTAEGEANEVIADMISRIGMSLLFRVSDEDSYIYINNYPIRYTDAYTAIKKMLETVNAKLLLSWETDHVELRAELLTDYSAMEEFDSSQLEFNANQYYNHVNHLICLGGGELKDRHVIHLFCDENGGLKDYLKNPNNPVYEDDDYILTKQNQVYTGEDEYTAIFDYPNAQTAENYVPLSTKPSDWDARYSDYYEQDGERYTQIQRNIQDVYELLTTKPANWNSTYKNYYTREWSTTQNNYIYNQVTGDETEVYTVVSSSPANWSKVFSAYYKKVGDEYVKLEKETKYIKLTKKPSDWSKNYKSYYRTDGLEFYSISGVSKEKYTLTTMEPTGWKTTWKNYYVLSKTPTGSRYYPTPQYYPEFVTNNKVPKWKKNTFYLKETYQVAPTYGKGDLSSGVYAKTMVAPAFSSQTVYRRTVQFQKEWQANTFYIKAEDVDLGVQFVTGAYYRKTYDNYADLVEYGIARLEELNNIDTLDVRLDETEQNYDIGDMVGARENVTGVFVTQRVSKKIIKIERDVATIRYEVS